MKSPRLRGNECAMIRREVFVRLSLVLTALGMGVPAHADVMEVGAAGYHWVAGGLAEATASNTPATAGEFLDRDMPGHDDQADGVPITQPLENIAPQQWSGHVAELARKYDVSEALLEAVVWQESRWRTGATSPAGAYGLAQLMPGTARQLGVDARDPASNLEGGARYLRMQLDMFGGDVEKALAAYNAGPQRVIRAGGVPQIRETQAYVAAIMTRLSEPVRR